MNTNVDALYDLPLTKEIRGWFDPLKTRQWVNENAVKAFQKKLNDIQSPAYRMKVTDIKEDRIPNMSDNKTTIKNWCY